MKRQLVTKKSLNFIAELQKRSPLLRLESFGKSEEGRQLPLMIFSDFADFKSARCPGDG